MSEKNGLSRNHANHPSQPRMQRAATRRYKAMELRSQFMSYDKIAVALGVTKKAAYMMVQKSLGQNARRFPERTESYTQLDLGELDELLSKWLPMAKEGDKDALDGVLKIMQRRAKLLGQDKIEEKVVGTNVVVNLVERLVQVNGQPGIVGMIPGQADGSDTSNGQEPEQPRDRP